MKEILFSWLCLVLGGALIFYLAWSFAHWNLNASGWSTEARIGLSGTVLIWMLLLSCIAVVRASPDEE